MSSEKIEINLILGNHITNIGNAFLDMGSEMSLSLAYPNAAIRKSSSFPVWFGDQRKNRRYLKHDLFTLADKIPCSFAVFSGMVVTERFIRRYGTLIRLLRKRGARIILNGAGPVFYSSGEAAEVIAFWRRYGLYGLVSRDRYTFETYKNMAEHAYDGIDCGFFLSDAFIPVVLDVESFNILTFDSMREPDALGSRMAVRPHHKLYPPPDKRTLRSMNKKNWLFSEQVSDILNVYANAKEVYSDRVHACVAAASFGKPFQLYSDSKRALLFERLGVSLKELRHHLVKVDEERLQKEKDDQVGYLKSILITQ